MSLCSPRRPAHTSQLGHSYRRVGALGSWPQFTHVVFELPGDLPGVGIMLCGFWQATLSLRVFAFKMWRIALQVPRIFAKVKSENTLHAHVDSCQDVPLSINETIKPDGRVGTENRGKGDTQLGVCPPRPGCCAAGPRLSSCHRLELLGV